MSGWLLDTNVLSELFRPKPNKHVLEFVAAQQLVDLFTSDVCIAEIRLGIETASDARKRADLGSWLTNTVRPMFAERALAVTEDIMLTWCLLLEDGRKARHTFAQPDLIIAATALRHNLTVVTRNIADFNKTGCELLNPWKM